MRHLALSSILAITTLTAPAFAAPAQYELDPTHTTVMFTIDHVGYAAWHSYRGSHHSWPNAASDAGCDPKQGRSLSFWAQTHGVGSLTYGQDRLLHLHCLYPW